MVALAQVPAVHGLSTPAAALYTVLDLGFLPGDDGVVPWAINETGAVVGWSSLSATHRAFLWTADDGIVELSCPFTSCIARDLNDRAQVVGSGWNATIEWPGQAIRWTNGTPQVLGTLPGATTGEAYGINASGAVVGGSPPVGASFEPRAFLFRDETEMLELLNTTTNHAYDINDAGQVAGFLTSGDYRAFRWSGGVVEDLGVLPGYARSFGFALNDVGQVAGSSSTATGNTEHVIRYTDGVGLEDLGGGGETNQGWGINNDGDVVGQGRPGGGLLRAFLYTDTDGLQDLGSLIEKPEDWFLYHATDINDAGQIVVNAFSNIDTRWHAVRLDPTPDSTPPTTTATLEGAPGDAGWWRSPVTVTLTATDASGVASTSYRIDGGLWETYSAPFPVSDEGTHLLEYYSVDVRGNVEPSGTVAVDIDATPPTVTYTVEGTQGGGGWWLGQVTIALAAEDAVSGGPTIAYRIDGGPGQMYVGPFTIAGDAEHAVEYTATDVAGNGVTSGFSLGIDSTSPEFSVLFTGTQGSGGWYVTPVTIEVQATDSGSGVAGIRYVVDTGSETDYVGPILVSADGEHVVTVTTEDVSGNARTESVDLHIDTVPPTTVPSLSGSAGSAGWWNSTVTVTLAATDASSGVAETWYTIDGGTALSYAAPFTVTTDGRHTVTYWSMDAAGHVETSKELEIRVDRSPPTFTFVEPTSGGTLTSADVIVLWSATDAMSGLGACSVSLDGGTPIVASNTSHAFTGVGNGAHTVRVVCRDVAGNPAESASAFTVSVASPGLSPLQVGALVGVGIAALLGLALFVRRGRRKAG